MSPADFMRVLFAWQRVDPEHRVGGLDGLAAVVGQLDGFEVPASSWESDVLSARVEEYDPALLDTLSLTGRVGWAAGRRGNGSAPPIRTTPIALFTREHDGDRLPVREPEGAELSNPRFPVEPTAFRVLAASATWGLFLLELAVAVAFLVPRFGRSRHWILIGFCTLVYAVAPVAGFGWVLLAMGLAQTDGPDQWIRRAYIAAFLFVLAYGEISITAIGLRLRPG